MQLLCTLGSLNRRDVESFFLLGKHFTQDVSHHRNIVSIWCHSLSERQAWGWQGECTLHLEDCAVITSALL